MGTGTIAAGEGGYGGSWCSFFQTATPDSKFEEASNFFIRTFIALNLPVTALERLGTFDFFTPLSETMKTLGPALFLVFAFIELLKSCYIIYLLCTDKKKQTLENYISLLQSLIMITGILLFVFATPVSLIFLGSIFIVAGAGLGVFPPLIEAYNEGDKGERNKHLFQALICALLAASFAVFLFTPGIQFIAILIALFSICALTSLVPSFMALSQDREKVDLKSKSIYIISIIFVVAGIGLAAGAIFFPPNILAILALALLSLSVITLFAAKLTEKVDATKKVGETEEIDEQEKKPLLKKKDTTEQRDNSVVEKEGVGCFPCC